MRSFLIVIFTVLIYNNLQAQQQSNFQTSEILVLDTYEKVFRNILKNDDSGIQMRQIQVTNQRGDSISYVGGLDIRLANEYVSETLSSTGIAITGNLGVALGARDQEVIKTKSEQIFLVLSDLNTIIEFLNSTIQIRSKYLQKGIEPKYDRSWRISLDKGLTCGFAYDSNSRSKWFYYLQIGETRFEISVNEAKDILSIIGKTRRWLQEEFPISDK